MPWPEHRLNDGNRMPALAYGHIYWEHQETITPDIVKALASGIVHLDTAQGYNDEDRFADAIDQSGLDRNDLFITTKWSRSDTDIQGAMENSLRQLRMKQVDLYLIHDSELVRGDFVGTWKKMELVRKLGYTKSIGLSNYDLHTLKTVVSSCETLPAVLQNQVDPHSYAEQLPLIEYCNQMGIIVEAFSPNTPFRDDPNGPIAQITRRIAEKRGVREEQVLFAWFKAKGCAVVTSSTSLERIRGYVAAGDIDLDDSEIEAIDASGRETTIRKARRCWVVRASWMALSSLTMTSLWYSPQLIQRGCVW